MSAVENSFPIPASATNAEKWILHVLRQTGTVKATYKLCRVTVRRVQQVVKKYHINTSALRPEIDFARSIYRELEKEHTAR